MPVCSLAIKLLPVMPIAGSRITNTSTMPRPPSQCVNERHRRMLSGISSIFMFSPVPSTDAPVVVSPDTVSNTASTAPGIAPDHT